MQNVESKKVFYTVQDFHEALGGVVSKAYIYQMIKSGEIVARKIGGKVVIPAAWVDKYIAQMTALPEDNVQVSSQRGA